MCSLLHNLWFACWAVVSFSRGGGDQEDLEEVVEHKAARSKPLPNPL